MDQELRMKSEARCEAKDEETQGSWHFHFQEIWYMLPVQIEADPRPELNPRTLMTPKSMIAVYTLLLKFSPNSLKVSRTLSSPFPKLNSLPPLLCLYSTYR